MAGVWWWQAAGEGCGEANGGIGWWLVCDSRFVEKKELQWVNEREFYNFL